MTTLKPPLPRLENVQRHEPYPRVQQDLRGIQLPLFQGRHQARVGGPCQYPWWKVGLDAAQEQALGAP